jgi:ParB-like chromosome segregation protein Spo0J
MPTHNQQAVEMRPTKSLKIHRLIADQAQLADDDAEFGRIVDLIRENGIEFPLKITADGEIADGRHRWRAAKRLKLPEVPCEVVADDEVAGIALRSLIGRRHYSPSQLAYVSFPLLKPAFAEAERRRLAGLKNAGIALVAHSVRNEEKKGSDSAVKSADEWASELAISLRVLQQAREVHELFSDATKRSITDRDGVSADEVTFKEFFEPRLLRSEDPYGLGGVLTAIKQIHDLERKAAAGKAHGGGKPKAVEKQLELFAETLTDEVKRWEYWRKWDAETRNAHWTRVRTTAERLEPGKCEELSEYHLRLSKEFAKAAKAGAEKP